MGPRRARRAACAAALALIALAAAWGPAHAQAPPASGPLPPLPADVPPLTRDRVFVREIRITGHTVFSDADLAAITAPYTNRTLTLEDLEALRVALTRHYVDRGYVSSGAILPDQTVADGVVTFQIVEGTLTRIEVEGTRWFRPGVLARRLERGGTPPLNVNRLQEQLQIILEDPRLLRLDTRLAPGVHPGESVLSVHVEERLPYRGWLEFDNYQTPAVGAERGAVTLEHLNLTGHGDALTLRYGRSAGAHPILDFRYAVPLTAGETRLGLQYRRNSLAVVEAPFDVLDVESESEIFGVGLRQPVYRRPGREFALELVGERLSSTTFLLGEPFAFSPGTRDGRSVVTALRLVQEWVDRSERQVLAARSRLSLGIDALGATVNPSSVPDGRSLSWLGQFQWVRRLPVLDAQLLARADVQLATDPLLPIEQIAVGGRHSVRGYRENTLVRDNAAMGSIELRVPVVRGVPWADLVEVAPFFDVGHGWNTGGGRGTPVRSPLSSVGLGLRWGLTIRAPVPLRAHLEVYWGHRIVDVPRGNGNLQDHGVHLQAVFGVL